MPEHEVDIMESLKKDVMDTIANLPDDADMDEIMYRLYVLDKIRKGKEDVALGRTTNSEELQREIEKW